jgi:hypothetical protein
MDQYDQRESFAIQSAIVMHELEQILEKAKKIEQQLIQESSPQVMLTEFYRPSTETQDMQPPKKKMKTA